MKFCKKFFILFLFCSSVLLYIYLFRLGDKEDIINIFRDRGKNGNNFLSPKRYLHMHILNLQRRNKRKIIEFY